MIRRSELGLHPLKMVFLLHHRHRHRLGDLGHHLIRCTAAQAHLRADVDAMGQHRRAEVLHVAGNHVVSPAQRGERLARPEQRQCPAGDTPNATAACFRVPRATRVM